MNLLYEWYQAAEAAKSAKAQELELRKQVFAEYFPEPTEGTNRVEVEGADLVAVLPYNYSLDEDAADDAIEAHIPKSKQEDILSWKPSLNKKVYNSLSKKARTGFTADCLTIKPGTPSLKIVPKAE